MRVERYAWPVEDRWKNLQKLHLTWGLNTNPKAIVEKVGDEVVITFDPDNLVELELRLKHHDWYYNYSDDYSVWKRGEADASRIAALVTACGDKGKELFEQYKPKR
jgi:hypothetical protein